MGEVEPKGSPAPSRIRRGVVIETWPPNRSFVGTPTEGGDLATLSTVWLAIPAPLQREFNHLEGRSVAIRFHELVLGDSQCELELSIGRGNQRVEVPRRRVRCHTERSGRADLECTLQRGSVMPVEPPPEPRPASPGPDAALRGLIRAPSGRTRG